MTTTSMKLILSILPILIVGFIPELSTGNDHRQFAYTGFTNSNLTLDGAARITSTGVIELTNDTARIKGHAVYPSPLRFRLSPDGMVQSFSTSFVFGILSSFGDIRGHGFAFFIGPSNDFTEAFSNPIFGAFQLHKQWQFGQPNLCN